MAPISLRGAVTLFLSALLAASARSMDVSLPGEAGNASAGHGQAGTVGGLAPGGNDGVSVVPSLGLAPTRGVDMVPTLPPSKPVVLGMSAAPRPQLKAAQTSDKPSPPPSINGLSHSDASVGGPDAQLVEATAKAAVSGSAPSSTKLQRLYDGSADKTKDPFEVALGNLSDEGACRIGYCHDNILALLKKVRESGTTVNETKARVLIIVRPTDAHPLEPNLAMLQVRDGGSAPAVFHVVLAYDGFIYDASAKSSHGVPQVEYFRRMFLRSPGDSIDVDPSVSLAMQERLRMQIGRNAITDENSLYREVRVREIPLESYLNGVHQEVVENTGRVQYYWHDMDRQAPSMTLGNYLGLHNLPDAAPAPPPAVIADDRASFGDIKVTSNRQLLAVGDLAQTHNAVTIKRRGNPYSEQYNRTDRGLAAMEFFYSHHLANPAGLKGKVVLDATMGGGLFVEELRETGVVAYGIDIAFNERQKHRLLADTRGAAAQSLRLSRSLNTQPFIWGDALRTGLAPSQVDVIYDTHGVFAYEFFTPSNTVLRAFREWRRLLRPGGVIRFGPIDMTYEKEVREFVSRVGGLKVTAFEPPAKGDPYSRCVEVTRVD